MSRTEAPPAPGSGFRSVHVTRTRDDGSTEMVCVEQYVAIDGEWVDLHEVIDAWREDRARSPLRALKRSEAILTEAKETQARVAETLRQSYELDRHRR